MDEETKSLARLVLRNAFYRDFSALVNNYIAAAEGVDDGLIEEHFSDGSSVYGRDRSAEAESTLNIWSKFGDNQFTTLGHDTLLEALKRHEATDIHLGGEKVFERKDGEWHLA